MIYCTTLGIFYKDRFDQKMFCGLNPFEKICKSPVSEIQSYDGISEGLFFLLFKLELRFFTSFKFRLFFFNLSDKSKSRPLSLVL